MTLKRIRLELARDRDFPDGSSDRGYDFIAPVGALGEHVSLKEHDGVMRTFRIVSVVEMD
jgi:hypothetical protein